MANECDTPNYPFTPRRPNDQPQRPVPHHPEFGKPSPIRPIHSHSSNLPFNIPRPNQSRPEHHRPRPQVPAQQPGVTSQPYRPATNISTPVPATPSAKQSQPWDPFKPVRPSAYRPTYNKDVVEIRRPENVTWTTPRAPRALYTSKGATTTKMSNATKNLKNFIDLTSTEPSFGSSPRSYNRGFGSMDSNTYVDTAKANENIKALLEGAFEDEEDKQNEKSKRKGKKKKGKNKKKSKKKQAEEQAQNKEREDSGSDVDDLIAQLQGVTVADAKDSNEDVKEQEDGPEKGSNVQSGKERVDEKKAKGDEETEGADEDEENEDEEDDEDDYEDDCTVEGLKVKLLPHQVDGVHWMCDKETGQNKAKGVLPKGGILADDMGLGKTVQAIALILTNRKPTEKKTSDEDGDDGDGKDKPKLPPGLSKSTLVVAPLALIKQWESEIQAKVEDSHELRVCVYHGTSRAKSADDLEKYDVVITTYGTLSSEYGAVDKSNKKSGLFSVYWYRIILDEAHTIKNRNAKATQSACALDAEYRWCLTGTPLQNSLDELQSLIKFLRIKPYNDLAAWRDQISRPLANGLGGLAIERLHVYLKAFMKRRTKDVLKLNDSLKPGSDGDGGENKKSSTGFQITKREVIKVDAEFTPGEMNFYKRLEQRTENSLEKMMGGSKLDYAGALVLLLRLRQACNHPDLVKSDLAKDKDVLLQNGISGSQTPSAKHDDLDSVADLFGALSVVTKKCDICQTELSKEEARSGSSRCSECEADLKSSLIGNDGKKKKASRKERKSDVLDSPSARRSEAQAARSRRNRRIVLDSDDEDEDSEWIVPENQRTVPDLGKAGGSDDEDAEGGGEWLSSSDSETDEDDLESPTQRKNRRAIRIPSSDETDSDDDDIYLSADDVDAQALASTKIRHLMKILKRESFDYKFIVFSVFTSMLDKIEPFLKRAGIGFARYDGSMRNDLREASLNKLRNNSATRVLLCSLRAGALGLNLTAASRVVILEPFWNPVSSFCLFT